MPTPWAIYTKTIKPHCIMCQLQASKAFCSPMSSLHYRQSTVASKHLIAPRNTGHPWGIILARKRHPKPGGQRGLWNVTANQHRENSVPGAQLDSRQVSYSTFQALLPGHPSPQSFPVGIPAFRYENDAGGLKLHCIALLQAPVKHKRASPGRETASTVSCELETRSPRVSPKLRVD